MKYLAPPLHRVAWRWLRFTASAGLAIWLTLSMTPIAMMAGLDPTFGSGGKVTTDFNGGDDYAFALALQSDGKIVVAGSSGPSGSANFALARYATTGTPDTFFNGDGNSDGKIITNFGGDDIARALVIQSDGRIVVAGTSNGDFALARYNADGSLDSSFDGDGKLTTNFGGNDVAYAVAIQSDGRIVAAGGKNGDFALARYNTNGTLDTSFNGDNDGDDGKIITDFGGGVIRALVIQPGDGKIVVAGRINGEFAVARYTATGALDSMFDLDGKIAVPFSNGEALALALQTDGRIVAVGRTNPRPNPPNSGVNDFALARFNSNGSPDTSFDGDGQTTLNLGGEDIANAVALQSDGKIVVGGYTGSGASRSFALARFNTNGALDSAFGINGSQTISFNTNSFDEANALAIQTNGRIVAAGSSGPQSGPHDFALARYTDENTFSISGRVLNLQGDGLSGVTVRLSGSSSATTVTNSNGSYTFSGLTQGGNYTLDAQFILSSGLNTGFDPFSIDVNNLSGNVTNRNFTATSPQVTIGGTVKNQNGVGLSGITVQTCVPIQGSPGSCTFKTSVTGSVGQYTLSGLPVLNSYSVEAQSSQLTFDPPNFFFSRLQDDVPNADFTGRLAPAITSLNPTSAVAGSGAFNLTVNGSNFDANSVVQWNNSARPTTFVNSTQLTAQISAADIAAPGSAAVNVVTFTSTTLTSNSLNFNITAPVRALTVASTNPASGVVITVSPADNNAQSNGTTQFTRSYNNNTPVTLTAPTTAGGNTFQKWQRNGVDFATTPAVTVTMDANYTLTAVYLSPIQVTVGTNPVGRSFTVDGTTYVATQTLSWTPGSSHTISTTSPQNGDTGVQFVWSSWSDGGAISRTVAPTANTTYTANFTTQYLLTMNASAGGTVSPASGFYNSRQSVPITATPNTGFGFGGWTGSGAGSFTGSTNPATVTMNGPVTETASFTQSLVPVTVQTNPAGRSFMVDGVSYTSAQAFNWTPGSAHTISTTSPQSGGAGTQYVWGSWSDGGAISHTVAPTAGATYTANFTTQHFLTMNAGTGGVVSPSSDWFNSGQVVQITATSNTGFAFSGWNGSGVGSYTGANNPATVTMNGPIAETASFAPSVSTIQFSPATYTVGESAGSVNVTVTRAGDTASAVSVEYATADGTATERRDYLLSLGRLDFAPNETQKTINVFITNDAHVEGDEAFQVALSNPSGGAALGAASIATVTIVSDDTVAGPNPIDDTTFYVRQQYRDFLNRDADPAGLDFWRGGIEPCGANASCREVKRIDTSAAFFLSIEFQETGYLVYRMYKAAYGDISGAVPVPVRLREFVADTQRIGRGVQVGVGDWQTQLENNKQAFASEFVSRARFTNAYPQAMSAAAFVDALNTKTGGALSSTERNALVDALANNTMTRAAVVRAVAEDQTLKDAEFNRAFVLLQYFGYLRRDPDALPDTNFGGYNFWLGKLNQFNGDFRAAEMVRAFLSSDEYRQRFGQ